MTNLRTVTALEKMIQEMQFLTEHPRMQQKNWVAKGKEWLPILHHVKEDLQQETNQQDFTKEAYQGLLMVLERVGVKAEKRDANHWGYMYNDVLKGMYPTRVEAIEAALKEFLG